MGTLSDPRPDGILRKVAYPETHKLATAETPKSAGPVALSFTKRQLIDASENHPDATVRTGAKQLLADARKGAVILRAEPASPRPQPVIARRPPGPPKLNAERAELTKMAESYPDFTVRKLAGEKLAAMPQPPAVRNVTKARVAPRAIAPVDVQKMVIDALGPAIRKALGGLEERLDALSQQGDARLPRKRL